MQRVGTELGRDASTPSSAELISLLGEGGHCEGVVFSRDEMLALSELYSPFVLQGGGSVLIEAGRMRELMRLSQHDGLRLVAFLASFCLPGEDPVKLVAERFTALGYEVGAGW